MWARLLGLGLAVTSGGHRAGSQVSQTRHLRSSEPRGHPESTRPTRSLPGLNGTTRQAPLTWVRHSRAPGALALPTLASAGLASPCGAWTLP